MCTRLLVPNMTMTATHWRYANNIQPEQQALFKPLTAGTHNASTGRARWQAYYTNPAVSKKVAALYAKDFALLGYETEV